MFSMEQKKQIADAVEKLLLSFDHPEMPKDQVSFTLHVEGENSWSWADIKPNWTFNDLRQPSVNPHNERVAEDMEKERITEEMIESKMCASMGESRMKIYEIAKKASESKGEVEE